MPREIVDRIKLEVIGGNANPAPPVGPALGQHNVNIMQFCREFNQQTQGFYGDRIPVIITIFKDHSFKFELKKPTASNLLRKEAGIFRAAKKPGQEIAATITHEQLYKIARIKMPDLNTTDLDAAAKMIAGTAKSMGIEIID